MSKFKNSILIQKKNPIRHILTIIHIYDLINDQYGIEKNHIVLKKFQIG